MNEDNRYYESANLMVEKKVNHKYKCLYFKVDLLTKNLEFVVNWEKGSEQSTVLFDAYNDAEKFYESLVI